MYYVITFFQTTPVHFNKFNLKNFFYFLIRRVGFLINLGVVELFTEGVKLC